MGIFTDSVNSLSAKMNHEKDAIYLPGFGEVAAGTTCSACGTSAYAYKEVEYGSYACPNYGLGPSPHAYLGKKPGLSKLNELANGAYSNTSSTFPDPSYAYSALIEDLKAQSKMAISFNKSPVIFGQITKAKPQKLQKPIRVSKFVVYVDYTDDSDALVDGFGEHLWTENSDRGISISAVNGVVAISRREDEEEEIDLLEEVIAVMMKECIAGEVSSEFVTEIMVVDDDS